jgi:hypothetical protein
MPIQNVNRIKEIAAFSPSARGETKRRRSTKPLKIPFRHLTQFPLNNPFRLLPIVGHKKSRGIERSQSRRHTHGAVLGGVLIYQAQDQGIEAVRPGAGRPPPS